MVVRSLSYRDFEPAFILLLRNQRTISPLFCQGAYYLLLDAETQKAVYGALNDAFLIHKLEDILTLGAQRLDPGHALIRVHVHQVYDLDQIRYQGQALWRAGKNQELANFLAKEIGLPGNWAEGVEQSPYSSGSRTSGVPASGSGAPVSLATGSGAPGCLVSSSFVSSSSPFHKNQEAPPFTQSFPKEGPGDKAFLHVLAQINQDFEKGTAQQQTLDGPLPRLTDLRHLDPTGALSLCDLLKKYLEADPGRE